VIDKQSDPDGEKENSLEKRKEESDEAKDNENNAQHYLIVLRKAILNGVLPERTHYYQGTTF